MSECNIPYGIDEFLLNYSFFKYLQNMCIHCSYVRSTEDISYVSTEPNAMALNRTSSNGTRYRPKTKRNEVSCYYSNSFIGFNLEQGYNVQFFFRIFY